MLSSKWSSDNPISFIPSESNPSEGPGERKLIYEFQHFLGSCIKKNPISQIAFPDIVSNSHDPWGEIKSVTWKNPVLNMGKHVDFVDSVRRDVYDRISQTQILSWEKIRKITGGHLGTGFLIESLGQTYFNFISQYFIEDYLSRAGGRLFVTSSEGWMLLTEHEIDLLESFNITADNAIRFRLKFEARPFFVTE